MAELVEKLTEDELHGLQVAVMLLEISYAKTCEEAVVESADSPVTGTTVSNAVKAYCKIGKITTLYA